jgi:hypothetical protein
MPSATLTAPLNGIWSVTGGQDGVPLPANATPASAPTPETNHTDARDATAPGKPSWVANVSVVEETTENGTTSVTGRPKRLGHECAPSGHLEGTPSENQLAGARRPSLPDTAQNAELETTADDRRDRRPDHPEQ